MGLGLGLGLGLATRTRTPTPTPTPTLTPTLTLTLSRYEEREGGVGDVPGERRAELLSDLNALVCRGHIDVAVKLSVTLPDVPSSPNPNPDISLHLLLKVTLPDVAPDVPCVVSNVHGVRPDFLAVTLTLTLTLTLPLTLTLTLTLTLPLTLSRWAQPSPRSLMRSARLALTRARTFWRRPSGPKATAA